MTFKMSSASVPKGATKKVTAKDKKLSTNYKHQTSTKIDNPVPTSSHVAKMTKKKAIGNKHETPIGKNKKHEQSESKSFEKREENGLINPKTGKRKRTFVV